MFGVRRNADMITQAEELEVIEEEAPVLEPEAPVSNGANSN